MMRGLSLVFAFYLLSAWIGVCSGFEWNMGVGDAGGSGVAEALSRVRRETTGGNLTCPRWTSAGLPETCPGPYCGAYGNPPLALLWDACVSPVCTRVAQELAAAGLAQAGSFCAVNFTAGWLPQENAIAVCCCMGTVMCTNTPPINVAGVIVSVGPGGGGGGAPPAPPATVDGVNGTAGTPNNPPAPSGGVNGTANGTASGAAANPTGGSQGGGSTTNSGSSSGNATQSTSSNTNNGTSATSESSSSSSNSSTSSSQSGSNSNGVSATTCPSLITAGEVLQCGGPNCGVFITEPSTELVDGCVEQTCNAIYAANSPLVAGVTGGVCVSDMPSSAIQGASGSANKACCCAKSAWPCPSSFTTFSYDSVFNSNNNNA